MLKGVNDSPAEARELVRLLQGIPAKVNLIPFNPWPGAPYECSTDAAIKAFSDIVFAAGYSAPVRTPRGRDIAAACGQLKSVSVRARRAATVRPAAPAPLRPSEAQPVVRCVDDVGRRDRHRRYLAVLACLYFYQRQLLYFPDRSRPHLGELEQIGVREVALPTADGLACSPGICRLSPPGGRPVIVYFHGNGGNIAYRADRIQRFAREGYGVLLVEYRGYGGNPGAPSEAGLFEDAAAALRFLAAQGVPRAPDRAVRRVARHRGRGAGGGNA